MGAMMSDKITWREMIADEMKDRGDEWGNIIETDLTGEQADSELYASDECCNFTVWTHTRVYFPLSYGKSYWCASGARKSAITHP